jgi:hypothetical protein
VHDPAFVFPCATQNYRVYDTYWPSARHCVELDEGVGRQLDASRQLLEHGLRHLMNGAVFGRIADTSAGRRAAQSP